MAKEAIPGVERVPGTGDLIKIDEESESGILLIGDAAGFEDTSSCSRYSQRMVFHQWFNSVYDLIPVLNEMKPGEMEAMLLKVQEKALAPVAWYVTSPRALPPRR